jgi:tetratricopeptide (TPR) repeat protein
MKIEIRFSLDCFGGQGYLLAAKLLILKAMSASMALSPEEEAQLQQTIEMFEVIIQSEPNDTQSLEILKEAYSKLGREEDLVRTSKRIAQAYLQQGQLSSAILEFETVLQRRPDDGEARAALKQVEDQAGAAAVPAASDTSILLRKTKAHTDEVDDGRKSLYKIYVDSKIITPEDFDSCWPAVDLNAPPSETVQPFIQTLHERGFCLIDKSLRLLSDKSRLAYLPLERYDLDIDLARGFPADVCRRWCVLPFDRMSKAILVATANPFNHQAAKELGAATTHRLLWYVATPTELQNNLRKVFR